MTARRLFNDLDYDLYSEDDLIKDGYTIENINSANVKRLGAIKNGVTEFAQCNKHKSTELLPAFMFGIQKVTSSGLMPTCLHCLSNIRVYKPKRVRKEIEIRTVADLVANGYEIKNVNPRKVYREGAFLDNVLKYTRCYAHGTNDLVSIDDFTYLDTKKTRPITNCKDCIRTYRASRSLADPAKTCEDTRISIALEHERWVIFIKQIENFFYICYQAQQFSETIKFASKSFINQFNTYPTASRMLTKQVFEEIKMIEGLK